MHGEGRPWRVTHLGFASTADLLKGAQGRVHGEDALHTVPLEHLAHRHRRRHTRAVDGDQGPRVSGPSTSPLHLSAQPPHLQTLYEYSGTT